MIKNKSIVFIFYDILLFIFFIAIPSISMSNDGNAKKDNADESTTFVFENTAKDIPAGLAEQIKLYWHYQGSKDLESAYKIESPHIKYQMPFEMYSRYHKKARKLNECKILNVENTSGRAVVRVKLLFDDDEKVLKPSEKSRVINDLWIDLDGKWYHVYVNPFANIR